MTVFSVLAVLVVAVFALMCLFLPSGIPPWTGRARLSEPHLVWEGPDEDGDYIVGLVGIPNWSITGHGSTREGALACLGEGLAMAGAEQHQHDIDAHERAAIETEV
jgi:hypothetical protein